MMGAGVAQVFASAGHDVTLQDVYQDALDRAPGTIAANLTFLAEHGLFAAGSVESAVARVRTPTVRAAAGDGADFVSEWGFGDLARRQDVFEQLGGAGPPETILC